MESDHAPGGKREQPGGLLEPSERASFAVSTPDGGVYRVLLDDVPFAEAIVGQDMRVTAVNAKVRAWFPDVDFEGRPLCHVLHGLAGPDGRCAQCPVKAALADGKPHVEERTIETAMGVRTVVISAAPVLDERGEVIAVSETMRDVTEERAAVARIAERESLLDAIAAATADALVVMDDAGRVTFWNPAAERLFGYTAEEALGASAHDLVAAPEDRNALPRMLRQFARSGSVPFQGTTHMLEARTKSGARVPVEMTLSPFSHQGRWNVVAVVRDVSERIAAEEERERLLRIAERDSQLVDAMTEGVALHEMLLDEQGRPYDYRFLDVNPAFERIMGRAAADLVGKTVREVLRDVDESWIERYAAVALTGQPDRFERFSGELERWFDVAVFGPAPMQFVTVVTDITYRKQAEQALREHNAELERRVAKRTSELERAVGELTESNCRLQEALAAREEFLRAMSHELRTPLNSIIGFSDLLASGLVGELDEEQRRQIGFIRASGEQLLALVNDVLDLSLLHAGQVHLEFAEVDLVQTLEDALAGFQSVAAEKGLRFVAEADPCTIVTDRRRIVQIAHNLVSNAVKFTDEGEVRVSLHCRDGACILTVADTGRGIAPGDRDRIFEEFYQAAESSSGAQEGTGVGLAVVKRIVELLGGSIEVDSELGAGSTFTVRVPDRHAAKAPCCAPAS